jgi:DNA-directed RNA polymerase subunit M/transcription elongation factor TFIIS
MSQTRVPCTCSKCGKSFAVVYEIERPGPLTWKTVACPRRDCRSVVRFPIPQDASFVLDPPAADARPDPAVLPQAGAPLKAVETLPAEAGATPLAPLAEEDASAPERVEDHACSSCGHSFTLRYRYRDADAESVTWVQCPNCGASLQVWVLEGAHDLQI